VAVSLQSLNLLFYFGFFYLVLANSIESERDGQIFLGGLLGAALVAAVYGLLQFHAIVPGTPETTTRLSKRFLIHVITRM